MKFERAKKEDICGLRQLARAAEAVWGYPQEFMEKFDELFNITEEFLHKNPVYVCRGEEGCLLGFWGMERTSAEKGVMPELEYFYICRERQGMGIGRCMWKHLTSWCREQQLAAFRFVTSPQAVPFYEKMGARVTGKTESMIDKRQIPRLEWNESEHIPQSLF